MATQFLRCRGVLFSYSGAIFERSKNLSIDYSGAKYVRSALKIAAAQNHFFWWLKTGNFSNACGTVTLKSPPPRAFSVPDVHLRPRKHLARCTLDCGFKTPESPALRGFEAERCPITGTSLYLVLKSNGLHRPKIRLKKFSFSLKIVPAYISKKLPSQCWPKPLFIAFFNFSHKWPTFAFVHESGYTLAFAQRIAHSGSQGETGAVSDGALLLPSERSARSQTSPGRVSERRTLPLLGLGRRHS